MNIGAENITDYGFYFQWGDTQGYTASQVGNGINQKNFNLIDYKFGNGTNNPSDSDIIKYNSVDGKTVLDLSDDAARVNWGGNWRMPTVTEFQALGNAVNTVWTDNYNNTGVAGIICTDKTDNSKILFFPAGGGAVNGNLIYSESTGFYWSSSVNVSNKLNAYHIRFYDGSINWQYFSGRGYGYPIRGVIN